MNAEGTPKGKGDFDKHKTQIVDLCKYAFSETKPRMVPMVLALIQGLAAKLFGTGWCFLFRNQPLSKLRYPWWQQPGWSRFQPIFAFNKNLRCRSTKQGQMDGILLLKKTGQGWINSTLATARKWEDTLSPFLCETKWKPLKMDGWKYHNFHVGPGLFSGGNCWF